MTSLEAGKVDGYFQAFRNGILEYYWTKYFDVIQPDDQIYFFVENLENECIDMVLRAITYYTMIGIYSPILVYINLFGLTHIKDISSLKISGAL